MNPAAKKALRQAAALAWPQLSRSQQLRRLEHLEHLPLCQAAELGRALDPSAFVADLRWSPGALRQLEYAHLEAVGELGEPASLPFAAVVVALATLEQIADERHRRRQQRLALDEPLPMPPAAGVSPTPDPAAPGSNVACPRCPASRAVAVHPLPGGAMRCHDCGMVWVSP